jgi:hypothetical protein
VFRIRHIRLVKLQTVAGVRRRANLKFLNELETDRAFGRLPNGFYKLFLAWQPSSTERTTENLVSEKPGDAATLWWICSPRIRGISNFPRQARRYFRLPVIRTQSPR